MDVSFAFANAIINSAGIRQAPVGAAVNSQGRKPLDLGNRNTKAPEGRQTHPQTVSPFQGSGIRRVIIQGLAPLAIHCRPSGAKDILIK